MTDELIYATETQWTVDPGVFVNSLGELLITDGVQSLLLPAPAAAIWDAIQIRRALRKSL